MFKYKVLAALLIVVLNVQLSSIPNSNFYSLGFSDWNAGGVTEEQINGFISFVNTAASLYENDVQKHLVYIVNQLNSYFGSSDEKYSVIVQTIDSPFGTYVFCVNGTNLATKKGINFKRSNWSYLFYRYRVNSAFGNEAYISYLSKGSGLTEDEADTINSIIASSQTQGSCNCGLAYSIGQKISDALYHFSLICQQTQDTIAQINVYKNKWIYTKPKHCYYTVWGYPM